MGMYTQIRGWLNLGGLVSKDELAELQTRLNTAKEDFENSDIEVDRKWVCDDTIIHYGGNGSVFLFFGTELKNYGNPAYEWIKYLLPYFPSAEGRIDFQYEEEHPWGDINITDEDLNNVNPWYRQEDLSGNHSRYLLIRDGQIIKDDRCRTWANGYGNFIK
jgi:hypothetical protein